MSDIGSPQRYQDRSHRPLSPARSDDDDQLQEPSSAIPRRKPIELPEDDDSAPEDDRHDSRRDSRRLSSSSGGRHHDDYDEDGDDEITPASRSRPEPKRESRIRDDSDDDRHHDDDDDDDRNDRKHSRNHHSDRYRRHSDDDNRDINDDDRDDDDDDDNIRPLHRDGSSSRQDIDRRDSRIHRDRPIKRENDYGADDSADDEPYERKSRDQHERKRKGSRRSKKRPYSDDEYEDGEDVRREHDEKPKRFKRKKIKSPDIEGPDVTRDADEEPKPRKLSEFEKIKEHNKSLRLPRKREIDHDVVESDCLLFLERMMKARDDDIKAYKKGLPALEKIKMLRDVEMIMMKVQHREYLLDNMLLPLFTAWLDRLPDGTLPNVQVRTTLLNILLDLRMDDDWVNKLEQSQGLGKVIHFLRRNDTHEPNKRIAEKIMNKWAREVYKTDSNFHDLLEEFNKPEVGHRAPKDGVAAERKAAWKTVQRIETTEQKLRRFKKDDDQDTRIMAAIPKPTPFLFTTVAEGSSLVDERAAREMRRGKGKSRKVDRSMSNLRRLSKRSNAQGARPSVNGR